MSTYFSYFLLSINYLHEYTDVSTIRNCLLYNCNDRWFNNFNCGIVMKRSASANELLRSIYLH